MDVVAGDLIRVREGVWRVMEVRTFARTPPVRTRVLKLVGADAVNRWQPCTLLEPFDRPRRVEAACAPRVVSRARWMRTCAALVAASPPPGCPATVADAQVTLMPHQIDPVLAVLHGRASRLLLADAVGLGKTIQAALLVRELRARGCADRVIVLVPSGLREQWRQELSHRTGLRADIIDAATLAARVRELPPDVNPWSLPGILIVSLDFIKQPSVLRGASTIAWDILIADEAHNLNEGTDRLAAADLLARHSRHVVLLTATPHHGSDDAFATLCGIGQLGQLGQLGDVSARKSGRDADAIAIFRRTRQTMGMARTRKVHVLRVTPTKQEQRLHALLARYAGRVERECGSGGNSRAGGVAEFAGATDARAGVRACIDAHFCPSNIPESHAASLAMSILLKRASSSASSLERSLRRRLALLDSRTPTATDAHLQSQTQPALPFCDGGAGDGDDRGGDGDDVADREPSHVLGAPGLRSARIERAWLTLLIEASRHASRVESKPRALARLLRRCREPALIYTEYRDTLTHLAWMLPDRSSQAMLHGGLGADDRRTALARFASGDARVLLTTDAAGEGLNLHHRCRLVINVELPWNPNRLEQRIGRLDRLGQTRTVHAIHLVAAGTAEEPMLTRLTGRITQIAATLGDAPAVLQAAHGTGAAAGDAGAGGNFDVDVDVDADTTPEAAATAATHADACRSISAEAIDVAVQLQHLRAMRARAWRIGRRRTSAAAITSGRIRRANDTQASRGDPLLTLDERAPLIAVVRRHKLGARALERVELAARGSPATPFSQRPPDECSCLGELHLCHVTEPTFAATDCRRSGVAELCVCDSRPGLSTVEEPPAPGLICLWRTRQERDDGRAQSRAGPPAQVLTAIHVGCDVPIFTSHKAIAAFVTSTLERCSARVSSLLDQESTAARERLDSADRARVERLARRDDAIATEMVAMLQARAASSGVFQPLLFEDIAMEKTARAGASYQGDHPRAPAPLDTGAGTDVDAGVDVDASGDVDVAASAGDSKGSVESRLVMALVLR